jgi:anhydro-N-acetylmuramic acid kinase
VELLKKLNSLAYYSLPPPKSLGLEWVKTTLLDRFSWREYSTADLMRTLTEHIATQIDASIKREKNRYFTAGDQKILVTGGGAHNDFLMERLRDMSRGFSYILPDSIIIDFKEALVFAFLGVLRIRNEINIWSSVTGASGDSSGGIIYDNL